jgi:hypothetical protein
MDTSNQPTIDTCLLVRDLRKVYGKGVAANDGNSLP